MPDRFSEKDSPPAMPLATQADGLAADGLAADGLAADGLRHLLFEAAGDAILACTLEGVAVDCNPAALKLLACTREEILGTTPLDWSPEIQPDGQRSDQHVAQQVGRVLAGERVHFEWRNQRRDGTPVDVDVTLSLACVGEQRLIVVVSRDITQRKQIENALRERERQFATLFNQSPDPAWIIIDRRFVECNEAAVRTLGYGDRAQFLFTHPSVLSPEYQPDGEHSASKADRMMRLACERGLHRFEWVHTRADGSHFWAEVTLSAIILQGRQAIYCVWRDISARKSHEEQLRLDAIVFQSTADGVVITDRQAFIISTNRAFSRITGYSAEEARGKKIRMLHAGRQDAAFYSRLWQVLEERGVWQGELWMRRKNGEIFPEWLTITAVRNEQGATRHYVGVFSDITVIKRSQAELERLAHFDQLTDLPNRVLFKDRLHHALERAERYQHRVALLLLDLDGFKTVNDSLGHPVGDRLLQLVAARIKACLRVEDTVARLGGDEFALILASLESGEDCLDAARKILLAMQVPYDIEGAGALITASIGIAIYPEDGCMADELIRNADTAMYGAKEAGRNTYRFYRAEMTLIAQQRLAGEKALRRAIEQNEFEVWYQPQWNMQTGKYIGAEALLRWRDPQQGLISPLEFIPLAERSGLIIPLGEWVLLRVCADIRRWLDAGLRCGKLSINVAGSQLCRSDFALALKRAMAASTIAPHTLGIELTESLLMENAGEASRVLCTIRAMGIATAIDDFGTGYSSLAYLKELPIDTLKIDRAFVAGLPGNPHDAAIARAIIAMGHSLEFTIVAEGIENEAQRDFLKQEGCDEAQGYFFARPMPCDCFASLLAAQTGEMSV